MGVCVCVYMYMYMCVWHPKTERKERGVIEMRFFVLNEFRLVSEIFSFELFAEECSGINEDYADEDVMRGYLETCRRVRGFGSVTFPADCLHVLI